MHNVVLSLLKLPLIAWNGKSFASQAYDAAFTRIVEADRAADDSWDNLPSPEAVRALQAKLREEGLACSYAMIGADHSGILVYDFNGQIVSVEYD